MKKLLACGLGLLGGLFLARGSMALAPAELDQCGQGDLVALVFYTVGQGLLWRDDCERPFELEADERRYMEFRYEESIPADAFVESAEFYLRRNGIQTDESLDRFHQAYRAVEPGDTYAVAYEPGSGLRLLLNGEELGKLEDPLLSRRYFAIWLGDRPFDEDLKKQLLGTGKD